MFEANVLGLGFGLPRYSTARSADRGEWDQPFSFLGIDEVPSKRRQIIITSDGGHD
jgi:hypothetical protein